MKRTELIPLSFIATGILLRLKHYLQDLSLWLDEAWAAMDLTSRSFQDIIDGKFFLKDAAVYPPGFCLIEKYFITAWGNSEWTLRLLPLLSGLAAIYVFWLFVRTNFGRTAAIAASGMFVLSDTLIFYSAEFKPYSSDCLIALVLYSFAFYLHKNGLDTYRSLLWGFLGAIVMWHSNSSMFVLAGTETVLICSSIWQRRWNYVFLHMVVVVVWIFSFTPLYFSYSWKLGQSDYLKSLWTQAFMPLPFSWESLVWLKKSLVELFDNPAGFNVPYLAALIFGIGLYAVLKTSKEKFFLIIAPLLIILAGAMIGKFPFQGRLLLFYVPMIYFGIAMGLIFVYNRAGVFKKFLLLILSVGLFFHPVKLTAEHFISGYEKEDNREVVSLLLKNLRPTDTLFYNTHAQYSYIYYLMTLNHPFRIPAYVCMFSNHPEFDPTLHKEYLDFAYEQQIYDKHGILKRKIRGTHQGEIYEGQPFPLKGTERTWILMSVFSAKTKKIILDALDKKGQKLWQLRKPRIELYLYDLSE